MPTDAVQMRSPVATFLRADAEEFWPTADGRTRRNVEHASDRLASAHRDIAMLKTLRITLQDRCRLPSDVQDRRRPGISFGDSHVQGTLLTYEGCG